MAKLRLRITKGEQIRYVSHLDFAGTIERVIRRAKLPAAYSEGFNPHMKLAFASALAVGVTSDAEYLDIELTEELNAETIKERLISELPQGIRLKAARYMERHSPALMAVVNLATYQITVPIMPGTVWDSIMASLDCFNNEEQVVFCRETPKSKRDINIKEYITSPVAVTPAQGGNNIVLDLAIKITPSGSVKPVEVLTVLANVFGLPVDPGNALINRTGLYIDDSRGRLSPIEL